MMIGSARRSRFAFAVIALMMLPVELPAQSIDQLPAAVANEVRVAEQACRKLRGRPTYEPLDLVRAFYMGEVGANRETFLIDLSTFQCRGVRGQDPKIFCGTGGCTIVVLMPTGRGRWTKAFEDLAVGWARDAADPDGPNVLLRIMTVGTQCDKPRAEECIFKYRAEGTRLIEAK